MALPVLDGNQSATTLSSVVTGGEHIVAHTVVSLGSTAISNITSAVSGSVVSISNFPATQTIAGTVTMQGVDNDANGALRNILPVPIISGGEVQNNGNRLPVAITSDQGNTFLNSSYGGIDQIPVYVYNSVTIGSLPAISGTVTANLRSELEDQESGYFHQLSRVFYFDESSNYPIEVKQSSPLPISGTIAVGNSLTIGSLPRVTFIDGSGTVTTANSAITVFASSTTRSYLLVQVTTGSAFVNVGATATTLNGISLTAGQGYAWETTIPQGIVSLISTTTSSRYVAKEA